jgi:hypothetical protein
MATTTTTIVAPRRPVQIYRRDGREVYADTGRPVDERLGSHVVLRIIDDPERWATAIEAEADTELAKWPKRERPTFAYRRDQAYESATRVRTEGRIRTIYTHYHGAEPAEAHVASRRPEPGVRYQVALITETAACPDCKQPRIFVDGQWWHHSLRYPVECARRPDLEPHPAEQRTDGEWEIDTGTGSMTCGYCNETASWAHAALGYAQLTGYHMLGIHRPTGDLVVLAEATTLTGEITVLPHHCDKIPDHLHATYADELTRRTI